MDLALEDIETARALWEEWTAGSGFNLDVVVLGLHEPAEMDQDRPLGAIVRATLSLRLIIHQAGEIVLDEECPYDGEALRASVRALATTIGRLG